MLSSALITFETKVMEWRVDEESALLCQIFNLEQLQKQSNKTEHTGCFKLLLKLYYYSANFVDTFNEFVRHWASLDNYRRIFYALSFHSQF